VSTTNGTGGGSAALPPTPGENYHVMHRIAAPTVPPSLPSEVGGYDREDFHPALRALLDILREDLPEDVNTTDREALFREEMPAGLKALILTAVHRGGLEMQLPLAAARDLALDSYAFGFPDTRVQAYYLPAGSGGWRFAPDQLGTDYVFVLGCTPDGEVFLLAGWDEGAENVLFGSLTIGGYEDDGARRLGDISALLAQVAEWIEEVDEDADTELAQGWLDLCRERGLLDE